MEAGGIAVVFVSMPLAAEPCRGLLWSKGRVYIDEAAR
jgi:hypothetical protein